MLSACGMENEKIEKMLKLKLFFFLYYSSQVGWKVEQTNNFHLFILLFSKN